mmetsp:Transcript_7719/g.11506  ORF Transcript_7719/g.11506 Transcript_7719/m.11506 type:complete len:609 (-) Transcript_7719:208-2034(-)
MRFTPLATTIFLVTASFTAAFQVPASSLSPTTSWSSSSSSFSTKSIPGNNGYPQRNYHRQRSALLHMSTTSTPELKIYNSLTRKKDPFQPLSPEVVTMYTCGPTIYDSAHVGNFRAFLTYDLLKRVLLHSNYKVKHVCNLTDVDDKIIARCNRENKSLMELTTEFEQAFMDDLKALNCILADEYPRATDHIDDMVKLIQELEAKGLAYQSEKEGSWYFNVANQEGYGTKLVQLDPEKMKSNASGLAGAQRTASSESSDSDDDESATMDADEYDIDKVGVRDFALWKSPKANFDREDALWDTVIGKGRPGWHLECSAMARRYLGDTIDIHCGGIDLKFPHHENEIAQSEGATGKTFCNCWLHNGFVNIGDEKMSKSKGNFLTLRGACPKPDDVRAYRYLIVTSHYRNPLSFTDAAMGAAKGALKRLDSIRSRLGSALEGYDNSKSDVEENTNEIVAVVQKELIKFQDALADDLSTPRAVASLFAVVKAAENEFKRVKKAEKDDDTDDSPPLDLCGLAAVKGAIEHMDEVFGVFYDVPKASSSSEGDGADEEDDEDGATVPPEVVELVAARAAAKDAKDWELADSLRSRIGELGFAVKDVKGGEPIVSRI